VDAVSAAAAAGTGAGSLKLSRGPGGEILLLYEKSRRGSSSQQGALHSDAHASLR
jgi:hypothetical protein